MFSLNHYYLVSADAFSQRKDGAEADLRQEFCRFLGCPLKRLVIGINRSETGYHARVPLKVVHE